MPANLSGSRAVLFLEEGHGSIQAKVEGTFEPEPHALKTSRMSGLKSAQSRTFFFNL